MNKEKIKEMIISEEFQNLYKQLRVRKLENDSYRGGAIVLSLDEIPTYDKNDDENIQINMAIEMINSAFKEKEMPYYAQSCISLNGIIQVVIYRISEKFESWIYENRSSSLGRIPKNILEEIKKKFDNDRKVNGKDDFFRISFLLLKT